MSVLVKGMKMPTSCSDCEMCYDMKQCSVVEPIINFFRVKKEFDFCNERHPRCPLVPVPPHGRLIDADELEDELHYRVGIFNGEAELSVTCKQLDAAPTIIPAEEGE